MWIAPCVQSTGASGLLKEEPNDEIGVGERGKELSAVGTDHVGMRRNREGQLVTLAWGSRNRPHCHSKPPAILPPRFPSGAFAKHRLQSPRPAHPFRRWSFPSAQGEGKELGHHTPFSPSAPPRPPSRKCPPPPAPLAGAAPTAALYQFRHMGARRPLDLPQCSNLRKETESRLTPICSCDLLCREKGLRLLGNAGKHKFPWAFIEKPPVLWRGAGAGVRRDAQPHPSGFLKDNAGSSGQSFLPFLFLHSPLFPTLDWRKVLYKIEFWLLRNFQNLWDGCYLSQLFTCSESVHLSQAEWPFPPTPWQT